MGIECWVIALLAVLVGACERSVPGGTDTPPPYRITSAILFSEGSGVRKIHTAKYDTVWHYGGMHDTVFAGPKGLAATADGALYVLDVIAQRVVRFSPTGELEWGWGTVGEGPGEVRGVRAIDATPDGGVVLADSENCRLVFLSSEGVLMREQRTACDFSLIEGVVALASGNIVLDTSGELPWVLMDGDVSTPLEVPWSGFVDRPFIQRYGTVASWGDGDGWVFGLVTGNGWFVWEGGGVVGVFPYVEHTDFPPISVTRDRSGETVRTYTRVVSYPDVAAYDLDVWMDTLFVLAEGSDRDRRVVDKYSIGDGSYLHSQPLPEGVKANNIAVRRGTVFVIHTPELFPYVTALRYRSEKE